MGGNLIKEEGPVLRKPRNLPYMMARNKVKGEAIKSQKSSEDGKRDIFSIEESPKKGKKEYIPRYEHQMADISISSIDQRLLFITLKVA